MRTTCHSRARASRVRWGGYLGGPLRRLDPPHWRRQPLLGLTCVGMPSGGRGPTQLLCSCHQSGAHGMAGPDDAMRESRSLSLSSSSSARKIRGLMLCALLAPCLPILLRSQMLCPPFRRLIAQRLNALPPFLRSSYPPIPIAQRSNALPPFLQSSYPPIQRSIASLLALLVVSPIASLVASLDALLLRLRRLRHQHR